MNTTLYERSRKMDTIMNRSSENKREKLSSIFVSERFELSIRVLTKLIVRKRIRYKIVTSDDGGGMELEELVPFNSEIIKDKFLYLPQKINRSLLCCDLYIDGLDKQWPIVVNKYVSNHNSYGEPMIFVSHFSRSIKNRKGFDFCLW